MNHKLSPATAKPAAYPRVWRWHFYAGLFLSPTLITLAATGLIYLFKPQIEPRLYKHWLEVPVAAQTASAQAQLEAAQRAFPDARVQSVVASPGPGRAMQVFMKDGGVPLIVYVDPHSAGVVGHQRADRTLMQIAHDLHGSLLLGKPGEVVMELTAGWAFILLLTGLYLWWPRGGKGGAGVFWPRWSLSGRAFWKDFHAVPGFYLSWLIMLFLATGIPWTGITGDFLSRLGKATGTGSPPGFGSSPFKSTPSGGEPIALDALAALARELLPAEARPHIILPRDPSSAAVIRWKAPRPMDRAYIHVDMYSAKVLADYRWKDFGPIGKFTLMAVALHEGTWFGGWNQVLNSTVALGVIFMALSGLVMWWKRRPAGGMGAPPQEARSAAMPKILVMGMVIFLVLVPVAGISALAIFLLDWAVGKRRI